MDFHDTLLIPGRHQIIHLRDLWQETVRLSGHADSADRVFTVQLVGLIERACLQHRPRRHGEDAVLACRSQQGPRLAIRRPAAALDLVGEPDGNVDPDYDA